MGVTVEFTNHFGEIADALPSLAHEIVYATGLDVLAEAQKRAPVRTGHLRNSGHIEPIDAYSLYVVFGADYAAYVELGTRHMAPHPFLIPSVEHHKKPFERAFEAIGQVGRTRGGGLNTLGGGGGGGL